MLMRADEDKNAVHHRPQETSIAQNHGLRLIPCRRWNGERPAGCMNVQYKRLHVWS